MDNAIASAYIQLIPTTDGITGQLENLLGGEAESAGKSAGSKFSGALGSAVKGGAVAVAAIGTAAIGAGTALTSAANSVASYGDEIDKTSQKMGVSSSFYQEWDAVLQHSGTSMSAMGGTFKTLSKAVQNGSKDQISAFESLGLSMEDLQGMSTEEVFTSVVAGLQEMEEGTERTALASTLLGKGATEMGALFNTSAEDTQKMIDTVNELGGVMSDEAVKNSAAFKDQLQDLQTAFGGVKNAAISEMLPAFNDIMGGLTGIITGTEGANEQLSAGLEALINTVTSQLPTFINNCLPALVDAAVLIITSLADGIIQSLPVIVPAVVDIILKIVDALINNIDLLLSAAAQLVVGLAKGLWKALPTLLTKVGELVVKMGESIKAKWPDIANAGKELIGKLGDAIKDKISSLVQIGKDLVEGLKQGISEAWDSIKTWFHDKITGLIDSAKEALKIGSPSKVFANEIGKWIPYGMAQGIEDNLGVVEDAVTDMADASLIDGKSLYGATSLNMRHNISGSTSNDSVYGLLATYLPAIANGGNVTIKLEGDADKMFNAMKSRNNVYKRATGSSAFA